MGRGKGKTTIVYENQLIQVFDSLRDYWPLTVRQAYYQMVKNLYVENAQYQYNKVSRVLGALRLEHRIPWEAVIDRTRRMIDKRGVANLGTYVKDQCEHLFKMYNRCLVQQQTSYVELWTEKDALAAIFEDVAWTYCVRVVVCKGQLSRTFLKSYQERAQVAVDRGLNPGHTSRRRLGPYGRTDTSISPEQAERIF